jgi:glycosyltransferase involved in cell wall biosynthesis
MAWCFGHCAAFVMTSRAEACPNTVLEALRHGAVSLSTDHPPMPEFFAGTALMYRGRDAGSLAGRVVELAGMDGARRAALQCAARARAGDFTWGATVDGTVRELLAAARPASSPRA